MQTITLKARADQNGVVKLVIPTNLADREIEIVLVMQPLVPEAVDAMESLALDEMGYPIGYFEQTYGSFADEPLERDQPLEAHLRDELE